MRYGTKSSLLGTLYRFIFWFILKEVIPLFYYSLGEFLIDSKIVIRTKGVKKKNLVNYGPFFVISLTTPAATVVPMSLTANLPSAGNSW